MNLEIYIMKYKKEDFINGIRILGKEFVKNNRNKGILIINNRKTKFKEFITDLYYFKEDEVKIKMIITKRICKGNDMFKDCESLLDFSVYNGDEDFDISSENNENWSNESSFKSDDFFDELDIPLYQNIRKNPKNSEVVAKTEEFSKKSEISSIINKLNV